MIWKQQKLEASVKGANGAKWLKQLFISALKQRSKNHIDHMSERDRREASPFSPTGSRFHPPNASLQVKPADWSIRILWQDVLSLRGTCFKQQQQTLGTLWEHNRNFDVCVQRSCLRWWMVTAATNVLLPLTPYPACESWCCILRK